MAYLGNSPGVSSQRVVTTYNVASDTTVFTPTSGYSLGYLDVYLNGVKLIVGDDYTATNGTTFTLASAAVSGDVVEAVSYTPRGLSDGYTKAEADAKYPVKPTGTANGSKFLRDDNSWQTVTAPSPTAVSDQDNTSTGYFDVPSGTTAQRPGTPTEGMIRYNTSNAEYEVYQAGSWKALTTQAVGMYSVDALVVAGGGSGGGATSGLWDAGGGGAGGYQALSAVGVSSGTAYTITVGAGGSGSTTSTNNGSASSISTVGSASVGGGGGASGGGATGGSGGSGGGGAHNNGLGGSGTSGQGNAGGAASTGSPQYGAGGGGGAGAAGQAGNANYGGAGGAGLNWLSLGTTYAGGGGGGVYGGSSAGAGGSGGGGAGGANSSGTAGTANRGAGGGGAAGNSSSYAGGNGGSGIVVIRYLGTQRGSGGTVSSAGGYTYHTFTSSGTYTA
jgi:hypothetical protein